MKTNIWELRQVVFIFLFICFVLIKGWHLQLQMGSSYELCLFHVNFIFRHLARFIIKLSVRI